MTAQSELITKATAELADKISKELKVPDPTLEKVRALFEQQPKSKVVGDLPSVDRRVDE